MSTLQHDLRRRDEKSYFYNKKTQQFVQIQDEQYEARHITYSTVQRARKSLSGRLWINKDAQYKITKKKDKYIVEADRFYFSPFTDRKFFIKGLEVEFKNIAINPKNEYENIRIVTGDEYNELSNKKLMRLSDDIINAPKRFYDSKVEKLKQLPVNSKRSSLDENFNTRFAVLRTGEDSFEILRSYKNGVLAIAVGTEEKDRFTYYDLPMCTINTRSTHVTEAVNMAIEFLEEKAS